MDVRCTRCATEYEFDDTKVGTAGVTVKCSSCGHVFKVSQSGATSTGAFLPDGSPATKRPITGPTPSEWIVRKGDGTTARLKELTTLQKWIVEQRVTRVDEISRTGKSWKRLGEIQELASFFQVVDAANIAAAQPTMQSVVTPDVAAQLQGHSVAAAQPTNVGPASPSASHPSSTEVASDRFLSAGNGHANQSDRAAAADFDANATLADLEDDDPVLAWRRRNRTRNAALFLLAFVGAAAAVAFFVFPEQTRAAVEPLLHRASLSWPQSDEEKATAALLARVGPTRLNDDDKSMGALKNELDAIAGKNQENAVFLAKIALVDAALSFHADERARLIALLGQTTRDAQTAVDDSQSGLKNADAAAARARRIAPGLGLVFVANAWVRALKGERSEMTADLEVATSVSQKDPAIVAEARSLAALAQARAALQANDSASRDAALVSVAAGRKAAPKDRRLAYVDAALRVEAILAAKTDEEKAKVDRATLVVDVTALGAERADAAGLSAANAGPRAALLMRRLNSAAPNAAASKGSATDSPNVVPPSGTGDDAKAAVKKAGGGDSFASLMKRANRARIGDKTRTALSLYKQAVELRTADPKPLVGMGWSYLDLGQARRAITAFRSATKKAPGLPVAHFGLAEALLQSGDKTGAAASFDTVLRLDPVGPDSAHARNALKRLNTK